MGWVASNDDAGNQSCMMSEESHCQRPTQSTFKRLRSSDYPLEDLLGDAVWASSGADDDDVVVCGGDRVGIGNGLSSRRGSVNDNGGRCAAVSRSLTISI
ncbi:predicted protein [Lichtheimia corymbifera JMRC:FSU:9682]|uniref:Uncharacterized protein n=1 Tax=Lichtheimia corymbifera JMRC:FSU:9682 TaxID=1263082 RepID=A0A068S3K5_9FUNG|nr:predicted protein [Lichtheimia corymbifera JMRC:FSU:9682]